MKRMSLVIILVLSMFFVGCSNSNVDELPIFNSEKQPTVIYGNADDTVAMYYVNSVFNKSGDYTLELSVSIPKEDGSSVLEVLNSKVFKVNKDTTLLVDGMLVEELEAKVKDKTTISYKDLEYQVDIYRGTKDDKGSGVGSKWKLFDGE